MPAVLLSIPQLTRRDVTPGALSSLESIAARGSILDCELAFPGLPATALAALMTGRSPEVHGVVADRFFDRARGAVRAVELPKCPVKFRYLWLPDRPVRPYPRTMLWSLPAVDSLEIEIRLGIGLGGAITPASAALSLDLDGGTGPLFAAPQSGAGSLEQTRLILRTAAKIIRGEIPDFAMIRVPHLGEVARIYGPDGRQAGRSVCDLDPLLDEFLAELPSGTDLIAITETLATPVANPIHPNRILRQLGLLRLEADDHGPDVDLDASAAFALVNEQICHVYVSDPFHAVLVASAFCDVYSDGIAHVASGRQRSRLGLDHAHAGDVILVAEPDRWFAPDWWPVTTPAPALTRSRSGLLDSTRPFASARGASGARLTECNYCGVVVCSDSKLFRSEGRLTLAEFWARLNAKLVPEI